jgi:hypothetical protein
MGNDECMFCGEGRITEISELKVIRRNECD